VSRWWAVARLIPNIPPGSFHHEQPAWTGYAIAPRTAGRESPLPAALRR
jgi:hypothetical protein